MISETKIGALLDCITANEKAPGFTLGKWIESDARSAMPTCGTYGCLLGNHMIAAGRWDAGQGAFVLVNGGQMEAAGSGPMRLAMDEYGLSLSLASWLFGVNEIGHLPDGEISFISFIYSARRRDHSREACLNRLRKYVYYVLHKRELLYDDSGAVRETARRAEGNHMVVDAVHNMLEAKDGTQEKVREAGRVRTRNESCSESVC